MQNNSLDSGDNLDLSSYSWDLVHNLEN